MKYKILLNKYENEKYFFFFNLYFIIYIFIDLKFIQINL